VRKPRPSKAHVTHKVVTGQKAPIAQKVTLAQNATIPRNPTLSQKIVITKSHKLLANPDGDQQLKETSDMDSSTSRVNECLSRSEDTKSNRCFASKWMPVRGKRRILNTSEARSDDALSSASMRLPWGEDW
jgi:hypothetical protein